jgi:hypothetical protein
MRALLRIRKALVLPLIFSLITGGLPSQSFAMENISTDQLIEERSFLAERALVYDFISRENVRNEMISLKVNPDEALKRIDSLSDSEIQLIAGQISTMPAGEGAVGPIVGALVGIFIILLITDLLCLTTVFSFTKCAR